jgi:hypothetical protein
MMNSGLQQQQQQQQKKKKKKGDSMFLTQHRSVSSRVVELVAFVVVAFQIVAAHAQSDDERTRSEETLKNCRVEAASYLIRANQGDQTPFKWQPESLLKWQNTINRSVHGNFYVWTKDGRPEVVASIYQFYSPKLEFSAELQSLSLTPFVLEKKGEKLWTPKEPGLVLKMFDDTSAPPTSKPGRLIKMRQLTDQFTGEMTDWTGNSYRLRLMPKPLFRYESTDPQVLDGALFSLTYTTDPEVLVIVEARKSDDGYRWMYGFGRMNVGDLKVFHRDKEIWNAERLKSPFYYKDGVYTLFNELPIPKPMDAAQ